MSAREFAEWQVMFQAEELHPVVERQRFAQLLAAILTGPRQRKDQRIWAAEHFLGPDPWAPPAKKAAKPRRGGIAQALVSFVQNRSK